jgi:hypothetical protein
MKATRIIGFAAALLVTAGLLPATRDEARWRTAASRDRAQDYAAYLAAWPGGRHATEASARRDELDWSDAKAAGTLDSFRRYANDRLSGAHVAEAKTLIEELEWQEVRNSNSVPKLDTFLESRGTGRFAAAARTRIEDVLWRDAEISNSVQGHEAYLKRFATGRFAAEARHNVERLTWRRAQAIDTIQSLETYLAKYAKGRFAGEAESKIEELTWQQCRRLDTIRSLEEYLSKYAAGRFAPIARERIEELTWLRAKNTDTVASLESYLGCYRTGQFAATAQARIEELTWSQFARANTVSSLDTYARTRPDGRFADEARSRLAALLADDRPYLSALREGTERALNEFLREFPGHAREPEAREVLRDIEVGRDIVDLIAEQKVEIETQGGGIESVSVRLRRLVPYPLTVRVPIGSYFVSARQSAQNMVTTKESRVQLATDDWESIWVSAACANRPRNIPDADDTFTVQRLPNQDELARLMPFLERARADFAVTQAAVWIVTDDASYADLGALVSTPPGFPRGSGFRMIGETDTAQAMKICSDAGIEITSKQIWSDKHAILRGVSDRDLKAWLRAKQ